MRQKIHDTNAEGDVFLLLNSEQTISRTGAPFSDDDSQNVHANEVVLVMVTVK